MLMGNSGSNKKMRDDHRDDDDHFDLDDVIDEIGVSDLLQNSDKKSSNKQLKDMLAGPGTGGLN